MTYCQSVTQILKIIWVRCIPLSLRSKTRRRATPLLPTWIYSCQSRVTISCALPFTINVTISTSISQTFRSWVAIFPLRQPMVFLSHSSYGMQGLAPLTNAFFLRAARLSSKLLRQRYVMERLKSSLRKFYGRYGDLIKHYAVSLSQMLHDILGHDHIQWHPELIRYYDSLRPYHRIWLYYRIWPYYPNFGGFHRTLQRVWLANRGRLLLRTPGPVPFETCICSNVEEQDKSSDIEQQSPFGDRKISSIHPQNRRGGGVQNQQEPHIILTKYEAVHPTAVSENDSSSGMLIILTISQTVFINIYMRPFFPELVMSTDLLSFEHPSVLLFCVSPLPMCHCWWTYCPRGHLSGSNCLWNAEKVVNIVADTSPTIKRCWNAMPPDTGMSDMTRVQCLVFRNITKLNYVVSDDSTLWYSPLSC